MFYPMLYATLNVNRINTNSIVLPVFLLFSLSFNSALALQAEHEAERLLLATEQAFTENKLQRAESYLREIRGLGIAPPPKYRFFNGKLLQRKGRLLEARGQLENYVDATGKNGAYYREALLLINRIEQQQGSNRTIAGTESTAETGEIQISWTEDIGEYLDKLQRLYATDNRQQALVKHINSLLQFYAYDDHGIIAASRLGKPSRHRIHTSSSGDIISMDKIGRGDNVPFVANRFSVYGINPLIDFRCSQSTSSCWFYHPISRDRWLQIVNNPEIARELSKSLTQLIKNMQKSG